MLYVPVVSKTGKPLMPCHPARARQLVKKGQAIRRFNRGLFFIKLLGRMDGDTQDIAIGIDPGSKKEGLTVKSGRHTYLNIQADVVNWVKEHVKTRRQMRRGRRFRKTPCRQNRKNSAKGGIPPSTKARWQWKLRLCWWLTKLYPVSIFSIEDIKARTKGQHHWDRSFSPLEVGKTWFYTELEKLARVLIVQGWATKQLRDGLGLKKTRCKISEVFDAHCVDSWVLANHAVGGHIRPDLTRMLCVTPLRFQRRQLHRLQPGKGGIRKLYGGTNSLGFKRGSLVKHVKLGMCYVGGFLKNHISLHSLQTGKRLTQRAKPSDCIFLAYNSWRTRLLPYLNAGVSIT